MCAIRLADLLRSRSRDEPATDESDLSRASVVSLPLSDVEPNPYQPRQVFSEGSIAELAQSIKAYGLLQPIVVRKVGERYQLLAGERRLRACESLGWTEVPAIVQEADEREAAILALIENLQREDLGVFEEVEALRRLSEEFELSQQELADALGMSQSAVANKLRLLKLDPKAREIISREMLTERHARALLAIPAGPEQVEAAEEIARLGMSVREAEEWIAVKLAKSERPKRQTVRGVYKDARLFMNSVKQLVRQMRQGGIGVEFEEELKDDYVELRVRIPTGRSKQ